MANEQELKTYSLILERETAQVYNLNIEAASEEDAIQKALDIAHNDNVEWQESDFIGDPFVGVINLLSDSDIAENDSNTHYHYVENARPQDNVEFVSDLMQYSAHGALAQMFVLDALLKFSKLVMETPTEDMAVMDNGLIPCSAWKAVAGEIHEKLAKRGV